MNRTVFSHAAPSFMVCEYGGAAVVVLLVAEPASACWVEYEEKAAASEARRASSPKLNPLSSKQLRTYVTHSQVKSPEYIHLDMS